MQECIFCKIIAGEIPSERVYEDDTHLAFRDLHPKAPQHFLVVPRVHSDRLDTMLAADGPDALGALFTAALRCATRNELSDYRLGVNVGAQAGQEVFHTHVHVLGGWGSEGERR